MGIKVEIMNHYRKKYFSDIVIEALLSLSFTYQSERLKKKNTGRNARKYIIFQVSAHEFYNFCKYSYKYEIHLRFVSGIENKFITV